MGPFIKTLFGDLPNVAVVAALLLVEFALIRTGLTREAVIALPILTMAGVTWLARH